MTLALPLLAVLLLAGDALDVRAGRALERLCPCPAGDVACAGQHLRAARAIGAVAPDAEGAISLIGIGCHESRFAVVHEQGGRRRAVTWWQIEVPVAQRAALLADDALAARTALAARGHGLQSYACGGSCPEKAAELARSEAAARWAWNRLASP